MLLPASISAESPQRKNRSKLLGLLIFRGGRIVFVVIELFLIAVLDNHALHDLKCSLHGCTVERIFNVNLLLLSGLLILLVFLLLLEFNSLDLFKC
jgi:hypothetical protein